MVKSQCCEKGGLKKGPWTPEEDQKLLAYIEEHGHGSWRALPAKAGLQRCGKSCRLRWTNYLRPDIKRGKFSLQEEQTIIQLHALLGNRWSAIATHLPKRTDNEIKNYWNTHLKKRLDKMGIDPVTHKPKADSFGSGSSHSKGAANLSHMAQWESARLEAEARLVRESKLLISNISANNNNNNNNPSQNPQVLGSANKAAASPARPQCLDVLKAWQGVVFGMFAVGGSGSGNSLESPTSTLNFSENALPIPLVQKNLTSTTIAVPTCNNGGSGTTSATTAKADHHHDQLDNGNHFECFGKLNETSSQVKHIILDHDSMGGRASHEMISSTYSGENNAWFVESFRAAGNENMIMAGLSDMLVCSDYQDHNALSIIAGGGENSNINGSSCGGGNLEENRNYWNSLLTLVDASPSGSPVF